MGYISNKISLAGNTDEVIEKSIEASIEAGYVKNGELVVITAGVPVGVSGTTNLIKVHVISEVLGNGVGIGNGTVEGRVRVANGSGQIKDFKKGDIIVAKTTDKDMNCYIRRSSGYSYRIRRNDFSRSYSRI